MKKIISVLFISLLFLQCAFQDKVVDIPEPILKKSMLISLGEYKPIDAEKLTKSAREKGITFKKAFNSPQIANRLKRNEESMKRGIFVSELKSITKMVVWGKDIGKLDDPDNTFDLTGIEYCTNIEKLRLFGIKIVDNQKLKYLSKIKELKLDYCKNIDLSIIKEMTTLESLILDIYTEGDLDFITNLKNLKKFVITNSTEAVTDLSPLLTLCENGNLEWVSVENNFIDLRKGTPNREVIDSLIEAGVEVLYEKGNRTEKTAHLYE